MAAAKKKYEVSAEIEAYCTKCKIDRLHVIETLKSDGNINRVICKTCEGSHQFRRPKAEKAKKKKTVRRKKGSVSVTDAEMAKAKPYALDAAFEVGDIIKHKHFGPGKVLGIRPGGKIEVGFENGGKLLVCRR